MSRNFNGSSDVAYVLTAPVTAYPLSLSCWCYPTVTGLEQVIFGTGYDTSVTGTGICVEIAFSGNWAIQAPGVERVDSGFAVVLNQWHQLVLTLNVSGLGYLLYVDGVLRATGNFSISPAVSPTRSVSVGAQTFNSSGPPTFWRSFTGKVAKAALWNKLIAQADVTDLQTKLPASVQAANLVDYWSLCGLLIPEPDTGGSQNNPLTVVGTTLADNPPGVPNDCGITLPGRLSMGPSPNLWRSSQGLWRGA